MLVEHTASQLVWVFGVPQALEQLPQRAVHSALAIRQMVVDASAPDMPPCPVLRLAVHLGAVRVNGQATDPTQRVLAVGETLTLPVRRLGQTQPGAIVISPEGGRLVNGWVALEGRLLQVRAGMRVCRGLCRRGGKPGRETWVERRHPTRSPLVGRERELLLLDAIIEQVKAGRGQVVSLVGAPGMASQDSTGSASASRDKAWDIRRKRRRTGAGHPVSPLSTCYGLTARSRLTGTARRRASPKCAPASSGQASILIPAYLFSCPCWACRVEPVARVALSAEARKARAFEAMRELFSLGPL